MRRRALLLAALAAGCGPGERIPAPEPLESVDTVLLANINALRLREGAGRLARNPALDAAARTHARAMAEAGRLSHGAGGTGPDARARQAGYAFARLAENVAAIGHGADPAVARGLLDAWLASPPHAANLLDPAMTETGISAVAMAGEVWAAHLLARPL